MKPNQKPIIQLQRGAFTLVEMLVVVAIVAILAGILIPVVGRVKTKAKVAAARVEMAGLGMAIKSYKNDYDRWPVPKNYPRKGGGDDVCYGWQDDTNPNQKLNNNDLMAILMAKDTTQQPVPLPTRYWENPRAAPDGKPAGANHMNGRNPKKNKYIDPKESRDEDGFPGLSEFGNYHDPFGNDYKISMDVNGDGFCHDWFYGKTALAGLGVGLDFKNSSDGSLRFALKGDVMIWSNGPDRQRDPSTAALNEINEDNILSWR